MHRVFAATAAVFRERQLFRGINLVAVGNVILGFTVRANKSKNQTCAFGHRVLDFTAAPVE